MYSEMTKLVFITIEFRSPDHKICISEINCLNDLLNLIEKAPLFLKWRYFSKPKDDHCNSEVTKLILIIIEFRSPDHKIIFLRLSV